MSSGSSFQASQDSAADNAASARVCLGKITTAHGVRGLVKVLVYGEDPYLLEELSPLYTAEKGEKSLSLIMKSSAGKFWLAEVKNITDRTQAETLRNTELWVARDHLPDIVDEGEFYITDLIGMDVIDTDGKKLGRVADIKNFGAGDLLEIMPAGSDSFFHPFTMEAVPDIDLDKRLVTIITQQDD